LWYECAPACICRNMRLFAVRHLVSYIARHLIYHLPGQASSLAFDCTRVAHGLISSPRGPVAHGSYFVAKRPCRKLSARLSSRSPAFRSVTPYTTNATTASAPKIAYVAELESAIRPTTGPAPTMTAISGNSSSMANCDTCEYDRPYTLEESTPRGYS